MCDICIKPIHFYFNVNRFGYCSTLTIQSLLVSFMIKHFYKKIYSMYFFPIERPPTAHLQHLGGPLEGLGPQVGKLLYYLIQPFQTLSEQLSYSIFYPKCIETLTLELFVKLLHIICFKPFIYFKLCACLNCLLHLGF